ncbi:unnamed protein product [Phaeothamnion confervicola]
MRAGGPMDVWMLELAVYARSVSMKLGPGGAGLVGSDFELPEWDPLGFTNNQNPDTIAWYRAAELKHGRVSMLAALGQIFQSFYHLPDPVFSETDKPWAALLKVYEERPLAIGQILLAVFACEAIGQAQQAKPGQAGGDLGWDPLGLKSSDPETWEKTQLRELKNGRLAMLAVSLLLFFAIAYSFQQCGMRLPLTSSLPSPLLLSVLSASALRLLALWYAITPLFKTVPLRFASVVSTLLFLKCTDQRLSGPGEPDRTGRHRGDPGGPRKFDCISLRPLVLVCIIHGDGAGSRHIPAEVSGVLLGPMTSKLTIRSQIGRKPSHSTDLFSIIPS